jgi:hypothetical protein
MEVATSPQNNVEPRLFKTTEKDVFDKMASDIAKTMPTITETPKLEAVAPVTTEVKTTVSPEQKTETTANNNEVVAPIKEEVKAPAAPEKKAEVRTPEATREVLEHEAYLKGEVYKPEASSENKSETKAEQRSEKKQEIDPEIKKKLTEYESTFSDPMIKAVAEWRKNGGSDINDFIKEAGLVDANKLTIKELYTAQAKALGFDGDELLDAVDEKVASFENLPRLDQKNIEKELRAKAKLEQDERLKSFTTVSSASNEEYNTITQNASKQLEARIAEMTNKKWRGFLITDELSKSIQELAPNYAMPVFDESTNKIIGYNIDDAVEFAVWKAADNGRKILKANYEMGETSGFEKAMKDRTRISENHATPSITPSYDKDGGFDTAFKDATSHRSGNVSLSGGGRKI